MKLFCQALIVIVMVFQFFASLYSDFTGSSARAPWGFSGAIITVLVAVVGFLVLVGAGALSEIAMLFR